jgi:peroxiredoxin
MAKPDRNYRSWLVNILVILALFVGVQWWRARPLASGPAPDLAGTLLDGGRISLAGLRETARDRAVLVHFWATWCPTCRMSEGGIAAIAGDHPVLSVAMQSGDAREVQAYMAKQGLIFPVLPDPDGALASAWGVSAVPASFVVDPAGRIRFATLGYTTEAGLRTRLWAAAQGD